MLDHNLEWTQEELSFALNINRLNPNESYTTKQLSMEERVVNYARAFEKLEEHKQRYYEILRVPTDMTKDQIETILDKIDVHMRKIVELPAEHITNEQILFLCEYGCIIWNLFNEYYIPLIRLLAYIAVKLDDKSIQKLHPVFLAVMKQMATDNYVCGHDPKLGCATGKTYICEGLTFANMAIGLAKTIIKRYRHKCSYSEATVTGLCIFHLARDVVNKFNGKDYNDSLFDEYVKRNGIYSLDAMKSRVVKDFRQVCYYDKCYNIESDIKYMNCSRCKSAKYCSRICQKNDWKEHSKECKKV